MVYFRYGLIVLLLTGVFAIPSAAQRRARTPDYGVNMTFALYGYDAEKSQKFDPEIHLSSTFSTSKEEVGFIRDRYGAEEMALRVVRSIGLTGDESYTVVERLGPDYMSVTITMQGANRSASRFDIKAVYGKDVVLDKQGVKLETFETILLTGKPGMFGLRTFAGAGGQSETAIATQTLLITITAQNVTEDKLVNRPRDITHPTDENGAPLKWGQEDKFTAPIVLSRNEPTLPIRRPLTRTVLLEGIITPEGKVTNIRVIRSVEPELDKIAVDAFRRYEFQPAKLNGQLVSASWREEVAFRIPGQ